MVEVVIRLGWKPGHPDTIGPGKPSRPARLDVCGRARPERVNADVCHSLADRPIVAC
jgi:hypothetical protein